MDICIKRLPTVQELKSVKYNETETFEDMYFNEEYIKKGYITLPNIQFCGGVTKDDGNQRVTVYQKGETKHRIDFSINPYGGEITIIFTDGVPTSICGCSGSSIANRYELDNCDKFCLRKVIKTLWECSELEGKI